VDSSYLFFVYLMSTSVVFSPVQKLFSVTLACEDRKMSMKMSKKSMVRTELVLCNYFSRRQAPTTGNAKKNVKKIPWRRPMVLLSSLPTLLAHACTQNTIPHSPRPRSSLSCGIRFFGVLCLVRSRTSGVTMTPNTSRTIFSTHTTQCIRRCVESSALVFSLSSHRQSYPGLIFNSRFIDS
jgi:hypothetical protein